MSFACLAQEWYINLFNSRALQKGFNGGVHNFLQVSTNLPHILLKIGPLRDTQDTVGASLKVMCDTGAGLNISNKPYHKSIYKTAPGVVSQYIDFGEEGLDPIVVGSVDADSTDRLEITAIITYHLPYKIQGRPTRLSFGLAVEPEIPKHLTPP